MSEEERERDKRIFRVHQLGGEFERGFLETRTVAFDDGKGEDRHGVARELTDVTRHPDQYSRGLDIYYQCLPFSPHLSLSLTFLWSLFLTRTLANT